MLQIVISLCNSYLVCCWPGVRCLSHFVHLFCTQDSRCHFYLLWCVNFPSPWTLTFVHFLTACYMLHYCSLAGEHILLLSVTWVGCGVCRWQGVMREGGAGQAQSRRKRLDFVCHPIPLSPSGVCRHYCINATLLPCCHQGWWPPAGPTMMLPSISHHLHPRNSSRIMITRDLIWYTECHQWKEQTLCRALWEN